MLQPRGQLTCDLLGQLLPAGSTGFTPKLATGLVGSLIDPDEDLV